MKDSEVELWAYVHGELDVESRRRFEREIELDVRLRGLADKARGLDRRIRSSLSAFESEEDILERMTEQILSAWEHDQSGLAVADGVARRGEVPILGTLSMLFRRPANVLAGLAAAAAIIITVAPLALEKRKSGTVWTEPVFRELVYRGPEEAMAGGGSSGSAALLRSQNALRAALESVCRERGSDLPDGLTFSATMQALRGGAFSFAVQAHWHGGQLAGEWVGDYSGWEAFYDNLKASAVRIADTLAVSAANRIRQEGSLHENP
ncbi:MAG: hypothetical protein PHU80_10855 [Kiritimatiellae bacterium]|nr:hypothetical protein [Kiritimatiellia bacterium]